MRQKGNTIIIILILIIVLAAIGFLIYQFLGTKINIPISTPSPIASSTPKASPTRSYTLKPGWELYQNDKYHFEFSHPAEYKVLTDSKNLYGWPKAILLLYKGGQSYDLAIELWDTKAEYKAKYTDSSILSVYKTKDGKFITLLNQNKEPEVDEVISTFKFTN